MGPKDKLSVYVQRPVGVQFLLKRSLRKTKYCTICTDFSDYHLFVVSNHIYLLNIKVTEPEQKQGR